jgi:phosphatidylserine/phosphatidylglycerophosphate/cardiolipin synthase-like enzyme
VGVGVDGEIYNKVCPYAVWTGSYNFTKNAGMSFENALYIEDQPIVDAYMAEYAQIFSLSEPLDWTSEWSVPEYRIGT